MDKTYKYVVNDYGMDIKIEGVIANVSSPIYALIKAIYSNDELWKYIKAKHNSDYGIMRDRILLYHVEYYLIEDYLHPISYKYTNTNRILTSFYYWLFEKNGIDESSVGDKDEDGDKYYKTYLDDIQFMKKSGFTHSQIKMIKQYLQDCKLYSPLINAIYNDQSTDQLTYEQIHKIASIEIDDILIEEI